MDSRDDEKKNNPLNQTGSLKRGGGQADILSNVDIEPLKANPSFEFKITDNDFDYGRLKQTSVENEGSTGVTIGDYRAFKSAEFIQFFKTITPTQAAGLSGAAPSRLMFNPKEAMAKYHNKGEIEAERQGWKIHLSVNPKQIEEAWSIINPILIAHNIDGFKIFKPSIVEEAYKHPARNKPLRRKQFTIYQFKNPNLTTSEWNDLLKLIEDALRENKIEPGEMPYANKRVEGSVYATYRNDNSPAGERISDKAAEAYVNLPANKGIEAYNLTKEEDPLKDLSLNSEKKLGL